MPYKNADNILLIMNCKKYAHKALKQKATWLRNFTNMPYFHVIGDPLIIPDFIFDDENHLLTVKTNDDYNSLPKKVVAAYDAIYKTYIFKYIFKTDDDQKLTDLRFFDVVKTLVSAKNNDFALKIHYGGHIVNVDKPHISQYYKIHPELPETLEIMPTKYCSGRFYFLSALAVEYLLSKRNSVEKEYLEDYAVGYNLHSILKQNILNLKTHKYFIDFE